MAFIKSLFRSDEYQVMELTDPNTGTVLRNDDGKVMGIKLTSTQSEACKKVIAKFQNQHKKKQPGFAERERFSIELLQAATVGFVELQLEENGGVVDYTPELARDIYENSDVIRKQVDEFLGADENFLASVLAA